jgi:hypothetical protein
MTVTVRLVYVRVGGILTPELGGRVIGRIESEELLCCVVVVVDPVDCNSNETDDAVEGVVGSVDVAVVVVIEAAAVVVDDDGIAEVAEIRDNVDDDAPSCVSTTCVVVGRKLVVI